MEPELMEYLVSLDQACEALKAKLVEGGRLVAEGKMDANILMAKMIELGTALQGL